MENDYIRLKEVFPDAFSGGGIFTSMTNELPITDVSKQELDIELFTRYGDKIISPFLQHFMKGSVIEENERITLSNYIYNKYKKNWLHYLGIYDAEYNPIHNYDRTSNVKITNSGEDTETRDITYNKNIDETDTVTNGTTITSQGETTTSAFGWNGGTEQNTDKNTTTTTTSPSGTDTTKRTGQDTNTESGEVKTKKGTAQSTIEETKGNIGVTTTQQMLQSEIDLWGNFVIIDLILQDVKETVTIPIY